MKLNNIKAQVSKLKSVTDKGFAALMYQHTRVVTHDSHIKERFGRFGYACLYMDELGRGLVVEYY